MIEFLDQIEKALESGLYIVALQCSLTLPDICSGLCNENGKSVKQDYFKWYDDNIKDKQNLSGENCYYFRCGMIHEGRMEHENLEFAKIIFIEPNNMIKGKGNICEIDGVKILNIDVVDFCNEMIHCTKKWWSENKDNLTVKKNYDSLIKYYPTGLSPFFIGIPAIG